MKPATAPMAAAATALGRAMLPLILAYLRRVRVFVCAWRGGGREVGPGGGGARGVRCFLGGKTSDGASRWSHPMSSAPFAHGSGRRGHSRAQPAPPGTPTTPRLTLARPAPPRPTPVDS